MQIKLLFGRFLEKHEMVSREELAKALAVQTDVNRFNFATLLEDGRITLEQFKQAMAYQREKAKTFREAALELGLLSEQDLETAVNRDTMKIGDILIRRGVLTQEALNDALRRFKEYMKDT